MKRWVDIRTLYSRAYGKGKRTNLTGMLLGLGMKFEGRLHSGIADTTNIARVLLRYLEDGHVVSRTDRDVVVTSSEN
jgi:inhibitor of KinA sporulation pathway (predicted exonuclease)